MTLWQVAGISIWDLIFDNQAVGKKEGWNFPGKEVKVMEKLRICLRCDREFESGDSGNRICPRCKQSRGYRAALEKERLRDGYYWKDREFLPDR